MKKLFNPSCLVAALILSLNVNTACSKSTPEPSGGENGGTETPDTPGTGGEDDNGGNTGGSENGGTTDDGWTLIFDEEFDGTSKEPNPQHWRLCEKGDKTWNRYMSGSYDQAYQENGSLYLIGEMIDGEYYTGGIETSGDLFNFQYGKIECRARFVRRPQGNHTGIWMMPIPPAETWPKSGEIDIMEHLNDESIVWETVHTWYADDLGHDKDPKPQSTASIDNTDWNTYGVIWTSESITFTVNGEETFSYPNLKLADESAELQWPFDHPFYIILSQSLGGEGTWEGPITDSELPSVFEIDWVKVWQQNQD